jgi:hypothetical protein
MRRKKIDSKINEKAGLPSSQPGFFFSGKAHFANHPHRWQRSKTYPKTGFILTRTT